MLAAATGRRRQKAERRGKEQEQLDLELLMEKLSIRERERERGEKERKCTRQTGLHSRMKSATAAAAAPVVLMAPCVDSLRLLPAAARLPVRALARPPLSSRFHLASAADATRRRRRSRQIRFLLSLSLQFSLGTARERERVEFGRPGPRVCKLQQIRRPRQTR